MLYMDTISRYCFWINLSFMVIIIFAWIQTLQHLHCIPRSSSRTNSNHSGIQPKNVKKLSTWSVNFAALTATLTFSVYPICSRSTCGNAFAYMYSAIWWTSCCIAKISLYLIFIGRLFNPHFERIYQYSQYIKYFLWMLLFMLTICIITYDIASGLLIGGIDYPFALNDVNNTII